MSFCKVLIVLFGVSLLPSSRGNDPCASGDSSACIDECFVTIPPRNVYLNEGDKINITLEPVSSFQTFFFTPSKDGTAIVNDPCDQQYCMFDLDSPRLEIRSFNASISAGSYSFQLNGEEDCTFPFNISKAEPPTLTKEADPPTVLSHDEGPLVLSPTIFHGFPPGIVDWYKDGVNISRGDVYRKEVVSAEDRGTYTATINRQAGNVTLDYEIRINFPPIITITTDPPDTNPAITTGPITVTCSAISYPVVTEIELTSNSETVGSTTITTTEQEGFQYQASAEYVTSNGCPTQVFQCSVRNSIFAKSTQPLRICQKAPNVTSLAVDEDMSTNVSVHLTWSLDPPSAMVSLYQIRYRMTSSQSIMMISSDSSSVIFYTVQGLSPGVEYEFRVSAIDSSDSTEDLFSSPVIFTTFRSPENNPTGLMVMREQSSVVLSWNRMSDVPSYAPTDEYEIFYYKSDNPTPKIVSVDGNTTSITIPNNNSLSYFFFVRARNRWGNSGWSAEVELSFSNDRNFIVTAGGIGTLSALSVVTVAVIIALVIIAAVLAYRYVLQQREKRKFCTSPVEEHRFELQTMDARPASTSCVDDDKFIMPESVKLLEKIGQGEFSIVYRGILTRHQKKEPIMLSVAVKTLNSFYSESSKPDWLIEEACKMKTFDHVHVLPLTGICIGLFKSPSIVIPYMSNGSLLSYLRRESANLIVSASADENVILDATKQLLSMCLQVAEGMKYLTEQKFVHRDLAARNCMISSDGVIKVADFGLAEDIYTAEYFKINQSPDESVKLPIKWMALESIHYGKFDEKTDMWSYGVLCWEVFTAGRSPYHGIGPRDLVRMLDGGERLDKPSSPVCTEEMYSLMLCCWNESPDKRPFFSNTVATMENMLAPLAGYLELTLKTENDNHYYSDVILPL